MSLTNGDSDAQTPSTRPTTASMTQTKNRCLFVLCSKRNDWKGHCKVECASFDSSKDKPLSLELTDAQKKTVGSTRGSKYNLHVPKSFNLVSRNHASFVATDKQLYLFENNAKYGTKLDGERLDLDTLYPLLEGSRVCLSPDCRSQETAFEFVVESIKFDTVSVTPSVTFADTSVVHRYDSEVEVSQNTSIVIDSDDEDEGEDEGENSSEQYNLGVIVAVSDDEDSDLEAQRPHEPEDEDEDEEEVEENAEEEEDEDEDDGEEEAEIKSRPYSWGRQWGRQWVEGDGDSDDNNLEPPTLAELLRIAPSPQESTDHVSRERFTLFSTPKNKVSEAVENDSVSHSESQYSTPCSNPRLRPFEKAEQGSETQREVIEEDFLFEEDEKAEQAACTKTAEGAAAHKSETFDTKKSTETSLKQEPATVVAEVPVEPADEAIVVAPAEVSVAEAPAAEKAVSEGTVPSNTVTEPVVTFTVSQPLPTAAFEELASIPRARKRGRDELEKEDEEDATPAPKKPSGRRRFGQIFTAVAAGMLVGSIGTVTALASMST